MCIYIFNITCIHPEGGPVTFPLQTGEALVILPSCRVQGLFVNVVQSCGFLSRGLPDLFGPTRSA